VNLKAESKLVEEPENVAVRVRETLSNKADPVMCKESEHL